MYKQVLKIKDSEDTKSILHTRGWQRQVMQEARVHQTTSVQPNKAKTNNAQSESPASMHSLKKTELHCMSQKRTSAEQAKSVAMLGTKTRRPTCGDVHRRHRSKEDQIMTINKRNTLDFSRPGIIFDANRAVA